MHSIGEWERWRDGERGHTNLYWSFDCDIRIQFIVLLLSVLCAVPARLISMRSQDINNIHLRMCRVFWCCTFHLIPVASCDRTAKTSNRIPKRKRQMQRLSAICILLKLSEYSFVPVRRQFLATSESEILNDSRTRLLFLLLASFQQFWFSGRRT